MTIDEFIKELESKAELEKERAFYDTVKWNCITVYGAYCRKLESEYHQLAEWLKDYKRLKEQEPIDCANAEHDADGCLGYSTDRGGYSYCQTCLECPKASINNWDKEQEPCDDAISIQSVLDKMKERDEELSCICPKDIMGLPHVTQKPCEDCISRQAAINIVKDMRGLARADVLSDAVKQLKDLPSVTPQPKMGSSSENPNKWIPCSEDLPELNEEAYSNVVLISLKRTTFDIDKCQMVHITKMAFYDRSAISSDGRYMDTEGWVLKDGGTLSMDEVIAWMPLPQPYKREVEE